MLFGRVRVGHGPCLLLTAKMKLRVRFRKITRIYEVNDETKDEQTVANAKEETSLLFNDVITG